MLEKLHRATLAEQATNRLAELILQQGLKAGDTLPSEITLAASFGVSRQVIREALRSLQGQGVVAIVNGKGAVVRPIDSNTLLMFFQRAVRFDKRTMVDLIETRKGIEIQSAMLAAERRTPAELATLQSILVRMGRYLGESARYSDLDVAFHLAIASAAHNSMLHHLIASLHEVSKEAILAGLHPQHSEGQLRKFQEIHTALCEQIERSDPQAAGSAMALHFDEAIVALVNDGLERA